MDFPDMGDICLVGGRPGYEVFNNLRSIYEESFPVDERRDWEGIVNPTDDCGPHFVTITNKGKGVGMLTWWDLGQYVYVEHLAVDCCQRGLGLGGHALDLFKAMVAPRPVVLEVEPSDKGGIADRRIAFYRRHGFEIVTRDYIQPPYHSGLSPVPLYIMSTEHAMDIEAVTRMLHRKVYGKVR